MRQRVAAALLLVALAATAAGALELPARDLWGQANAAADAGDFDSANRLLNEILERGRQTGLRRYPILAESAAALAEQAQSEGNAELAQWSLAAAERLDSELPAVAFTAADLAVRRSDWPAALQAVARGLGKILRDYATRTIARNDLLVVLALAIVATAVAFAISLALRYGRAAAHDFRERLGTRLSAGTTTVLAFALLFLPIFLWLGPTWLVLWWIVLFFAYASWKERAVAAVLLVLVALVPLLLARSAWRMAALESPVVQGAVAAAENAYAPEAIQRLQALIEFVPEEPDLHLLLGNLFVKHGADTNAQIHYRRAVQLDEANAGAHLNIGNLHFLNNDYTAAISRYERAAEADPQMALAPYNHSVAAGELYRYEEQRGKLEDARTLDRQLVDELTAADSGRRGLKVLMYEMPVSEAWALAERIAKSQVARELYGNFAVFDPLRVLVNPLTIGALAALVLAFAISSLRRKSGLAGSCIKCGRTFCPRCKSAREATTYCTQCIHIYLKRDGVSLDTKRKKLEEVADYQSRTLRIRKLLGTVLPGSPQALAGSAVAGAVILLVFLAFVSLAFLIGRLAPLGPSPDAMRLFVRSVAIALALVVWAVFSLPVYRERQGQ
ncbi:MAG: hypothetical protein ACRD2J_12680 [Thermoanaerobaculia bacterium]